MKRNPKDAAGSHKTPISDVPLGVIMEVGLGMREGASKYGRFNFRQDPVEASCYIDALFRHIVDWWEGEDVDEASGLSHVTKAICTLVVLRDAESTGMMIDDRPKPLNKGIISILNEIHQECQKKQSLSG